MTMTRSRSHTLAQFARRARMSAQRLRVLHGERRLPAPDGVDPDGADVWSAATIDRWLRATGRTVPDDAVWPFGWPDASESAEVIWSGDIDLPRGHTAAVTIFDGAGQPVVYAVGYVGQDVSRDTIAEAAIARLDPDRRPGAVVVQPFLLDPESDGPYPHLELWRMPEQPDPVPDPAPAALPAMLRRFLPQREREREPVGVMRQPVIGRQRRPDAPEYAGSVFASEVARVLGRPVPLWWAGTTTPEIMRTVRLLDQPRPLPIADTITEWPAAIARLTAALEHSVHTTYPQAFALLARETRAAHRDVSAALTHPSTGDGWYLAAAPQPPAWPAVAEQRAVAAGRDLDPEAAADELDRLAQVEADREWRSDDPYGNALRHAILLLRGRLAATHPERVYTFPVTYSWPDAHGPICDEYRRHLTGLTPADAHGDPEHPTRRLVRLLTQDASDAAIAHHQLLVNARERLVAIYRDPQGRLVAHLTAGFAHLDDELLIEWPTSMPPAGWTEQTVIAADETYSATGLFAMTPGPDGALLPPQPVPNPGDEPRYTFGYGGNSPAVVYQALVRCALGDWTAATHESWVQRLSTHPDDQRNRPHSRLWQQIVTSKGALRLSWADVQQWVREDQEALFRRRQDRR